MDTMFKTLRADLRAHEARVRALIGDNDAVHQEIREKYDRLMEDHSSLRQICEAQMAHIVESIESLTDILNVKDRLKAGTSTAGRR